MNDERELFGAPLSSWLFTGATVMLGGLVSFYQRYRRGQVRMYLLVFIGEQATSAFSGLMVFLWAHHAHIDIYLTAAMSGIAGHMGSRGLFLLERWASNRIGADR